MGEPLVSIVCTAHVAPSILSHILTAAYDKDDDCEPALILLTTTTKSTWSTYTIDSATNPTSIPPSFTSPFAGMNVQSVVRHIHENANGTIITPRYLFIADERTVADGTLLLVRVNWKNPEKYRTVRVARDVANTEAVSLTMGTSGFEELQSLVGEDGVYRGDEE